VLQNRARSVAFGQAGRTNPPDLQQLVAVMRIVTRRCAPGKMVGLVRFELTTSCTPCKRATRLRYSPNKGGSQRPSVFCDARGFFAPPPGCLFRDGSGRRSPRASRGVSGIVSTHAPHQRGRFKRGSCRGRGSLPRHAPFQIKILLPPQQPPTTATIRPFRGIRGCLDVRVIDRRSAVL